MKLLSINVSLPKPVSYRGKEVETGIFKTPVDGPITVRTLNLEGDGQADLKSHGGVCKAIYAYPFEHYAHWALELDRTDFTFGQFGENLTVEGILEDQINVGDVLRVGSALLEVSQPRVPCFKLGLRMGGLDAFPKEFLKSGFVGFYLRVLEEGEVAVGAPIKRIRSDPKSMSIRDISHLMHFDRENLKDTEKALGLAALPPGWCHAFEKRLANAGVPFEPRNHPLEADCCIGL